MKKYIIAIFAFLVFFTSSIQAGMASAAERKLGFKDVAANFWGYDTISWAIAQGIVQGYPDGTFQPGKKVTEAEFLALLIRAYQPSLVKSQTSSGHWSDLYYQFADQKNYAVNGITADELRSQPLSRSRVAEILSGADGVNFSGSNAILYVLNKGYAKGKIANEVSVRSYQGEDTLTRAEAVQFIKNVQDNGLQELKERPNQLSSTYLLENPSGQNNGNSNAGSALTLEQMADFRKSAVLIDVYDQNDQSIAQGSGFIAGNGLIVTNYHVVEGGRSFTITDQDEKQYDIEGIVKYDADLDLAVLKPSDPLTLPSLNLGSYADAHVGQSVVAIGSPEGLLNTISQGIISGVRKSPNSASSAIDLLQITNPLTYGSSGGPLFNQRGEVIGITSYGSDQGSLNFAVSIDYVKNWLNAVNTQPFSLIKTIPYAPASTNNGASQNGSAGGSTAPAGTVFSPASLYELDGVITDAVMSPDAPVLYAVDDANNRILAIDYKTGAVKFAQLSMQAEKIYVANHRVYVAQVVQDHSPYWFDNQKGAVTILDADTLSIIDHFDVPIDPFDLVVDNQGYIYISSGSGQWTKIMSFSQSTHQMIDSKQIRQASYLAMHPQMNKIYAVNTDTSPRDISVYLISEGKFTDMYDSPYHGDYAMTPKMVVSSDGKYIFNGAGTVFQSANSKPANMQYVAAIASFDNIAFDMTGKTMYASSKNMIQSYDYQTFNFNTSKTTEGEVLKLFYQDQQLITISKVVPQGSKIPVYAVMVYNPQLMFS